MFDERNANETQTIRVLLVEDELATRAVIRLKLERAHDIVVVGEATDGEQSLRACEELSPDVVLMDVRMPVMDGIEAAQRILSKYANIKVVMLTASENDDDIFASLSAGATGYCLKSVESEHLYNAIRGVHAGNVWLHSPVATRVFQDYRQVSEPEATQSATSELSAGDADEHTPIPEPLSQRELEVIDLIVNGLSNQEIADRLAISLPTAKTHVRNILNKLAVDDRTQAAVQAMRRGLV
jgi:DNA-binding NarL/FixJ family response regulator